jgi:hypothetical protein
MAGQTAAHYTTRHNIPEDLNLKKIIITDKVFWEFMRKYTISGFKTRKIKTNETGNFI